MREDNTTANIFSLFASIATSRDVDLKDTALVALEDHIGVLDKREVEILQEFKNLCNEVDGIPTLGTLIARDSVYQTSPIIANDSIMDYVNIFIHNKKNIKMHSLIHEGLEKYTSGKIKFTDFDNIVQDAMVVGAPEGNKDTLESNLDDSFFEKLAEETQTEEGIHFGIPFIDEKYRGLLPGEILTIAGFSGSMKTTLAANLVYNAATLGKNTLFLSLEMRKEDMMLRFLARHSFTSTTTDNVTVDMLTKDGYPAKNKEGFFKLVEDYKKLPGAIRIVDEGDMETYTRQYFDKLIKDINEELTEKTGHGIDIIVIDHIQLLKFATKESAINNPYLVVNYFVSYFREKAARENYGVVLLAQTSRDGLAYATKNKGRYLASGIAEGNEIERASTGIVTVFLSDNNIISNEITVDLIKNRFGPKLEEPKQAPLLPNYYMVGNGEVGNNVESAGPVFNMGEALMNMDEDFESLLEGA